MTSIKYRSLFIGILIFCLLALFFAYFVEYILKHIPCNLCLIERIPYIATIVLVFLVLFFKKYEKLILIIIGLFFTFGTVISFYHFGIEQEFIKESLVCDLNNKSSDLSKEALLNQLKEMPISCKDVTFTIFGLSLASFNIFISLILGVITTKLFLTYEKNR